MMIASYPCRPFDPFPRRPVTAPLPLPGLPGSSSTAATASQHALVPFWSSTSAASTKERKGACLRTDTLLGRPSSALAARSTVVEQAQKRSSEDLRKCAEAEAREAENIRMSQSPARALAEETPRGTRNFNSLMNAGFGCLSIECMSYGSAIHPSRLGSGLSFESISQLTRKSQSTKKKAR